MAKLPFTYYMHDESFYERVEDLFPGLTEAQQEDLAEKAGKPFYEVTLRCEIDDQTGEVTLISASL